MISLAPGSIFAQRYRIVRLIGQGGMGAVFEVVHVETERRCALKVMQPNMVDNEAMRARFRQEAKVAALVNSEHIVDVYDAGFDEGTQMPFLVMELLSGYELRQKLKKDGKFTPPEVALYLHQTALALEKTHRQNIIHRDLKPENLFLTFRENGSPHVKILDFGVAKFMTESASHTSATRDVGTPLFMAPEQFTMGAKPSAQTDIYALGMIAYHFLTGVSYWADDHGAAATIYAFAIHVVQGIPEAPTIRARRRGVQLPPAFDTWFARATARNPEQRFQSALTAAAELADALGVPRFVSEPSALLSNVGFRAEMGSSWGISSAVAPAMGIGTGAITSEPAPATGAPLATTSGKTNDSRGKYVLLGALAAVFVVITGLLLFLSSGSSSQAKNASSAEPTPLVEAKAQPTTTAEPTVSPIVEPMASVSADAPKSAKPTKSAARVTGPAKPPPTTPPKKDLFTRD